jgi:hypothetical protein
LALANTKEQRDLVLNTFFETIEKYNSDIQHSVLNNQGTGVEYGSPSKRKAMFRKSATKSPNKKPRSKPVDENVSPDHHNFKMSPGKKMQSPVKQ